MPVGATSGEFMVDTMGGANYNIPITVPPGVAGMAPMLSLNYDSHGGDGLAGIGWSLGGLSSISRCPATVAQDGFKGGVNFDANDRFCLEGQRLIAISGTYGAAGSEYRTELDGYSKIVAYGSQFGYQSGPLYFKVWSKSGQVMEYGNTADSFIQQGHVGANVWAVNKISDVMGNFLTISYNDYPDHYTPSRLDYAGNSVRFSYETRPDVTPTYMAGAPIRNSDRLTNVQTYAKVTNVDTLVRNYRLSYDNAGQVGRTRLTSLNECAGDGACLPITKFDWSVADNAFSNQTWTVPVPWGDVNHTWVADFNGDGKSDIASANYGNVFMHLSTGSGFDNQTWTVPVPWGDIDHTWVADFNGDGKSDIASASYGNVFMHLSDEVSSDLLVRLVNGLGLITTINYKLITDNSIYTRDNDAVYPLQDIQSPLYVVSSASASNGIGGYNTTLYTYAGAKADISRGFLGFRWRQEVDVQTGIKMATTLRQDFPFIGQVAQTDTLTAAGLLLSSVVNTWASTSTPAAPTPGYASPGAAYFPYVAHSVSTSRELNGAFISTTTSDSSYDGYGNPTRISMATVDATSPTAPYVKVSTNTYTNDTANWYLGRLSLATVASILPNNQSLTRTSGFTYTTRGMLATEVIEPGNSSLALTTTYGYDSFGNQTTVTISGQGINPRTTTTDYGPDGRFPIKVTNALNQAETHVYDPRFGVMTSLTGPNGLSTTWSYDGFGRKLNETRSNGTQTQMTYAVCSAGSCPALGVYSITSQDVGRNPQAGNALVSISAPATVYYDTLARPIRTRTDNFDGSKLILQDTVYNPMGLVAVKTKPYFASSATAATPTATPQTVTSYDSMNRVLTATAPDGSVSRMVYNGLITQTVNALNQVSTQLKNSQGWLLKSVDTTGQYNLYGYDPTGNLTVTIDAAGNATTLQYDIRGRKTGMTDPDMGRWVYSYDVLGQLISQTDAKGQVVTMTYDVLGRLKSRTEPQPDGTPGTSTWGYDGANAVGKPTLVSGPNGYLRTGYYDALSRVVQTNSTLLTGIGTGEGTQYDAYGRVARITYPTGLAVTHTYNARGYLVEVRNATTNALYWQLGDRDADQQLTREVLGNGLTTLHTYDVMGRARTLSTGAGTATSVQALGYLFDTLGNLKSRADANQKTSETFAYDSLNRLTGATLSGQVGATPFQDPRTYAYDSIGNLTSKSDRGNYSYGAGSAGPHAVTATSGVAGGKGAVSYTYDANGNQVSGDGRTLSYTSFNVPYQITQGANTTQFLYDPDHARTRQIATTNGVTKTTYYLHPRLDEGAHVEISVTGSLVEYTCFIYAGNKLIAQYHTRNDSSPAQLRYFHTDHLGSIDTVTDETGVVIERMSYDPFGKRRYPDGRSDPSTSLQGINTDYGYTQHEHLDGVGLIHMNGRVYDPSLGRFLSADPTIQYPESTQNLNRYSYVDNNPLSYTDPSGYGFLSGLFRAIGNIFRGIIRNFRSILAIGAAILLSPYLTPYGAGFVSGLISGGDLKSGIIGALTAGAFQGVGNLGFDPGSIENIVAHGLVGGATSAAQGGSFQSGFLAGGFGEAFAPLANGIGKTYGITAGTVAAAVAGGAGSVLGGGKFANGAITGAFGQLFNDFGHMFAGTDAHQVLLEYLQERDFGQWQGNITLDGLFGTGRPDLIYNESPSPIYEIKPFGSDANAESDLKTYLGTAGSNATLGDPMRVFKGELSITLPAKWFFGRTTYTYRPGRSAGVITYTVDRTSVFQEITQAFHARPAGGGSWLPMAPPRTPPGYIIP